MQFSKVITGLYKATRKDGQVIYIENRVDEETNKPYWTSTYEDDFNNDNYASAKTKRELVERENHIETLI